MARHRLGLRVVTAGQDGGSRLSVELGDQGLEPALAGPSFSSQDEAADDYSVPIGWQVVLGLRRRYGTERWWGTAGLLQVGDLRFDRARQSGLRRLNLLAAAQTRLSVPASCLPKIA